MLIGSFWQQAKSNSLCRLGDRKALRDRRTGRISGAPGLRGVDSASASCYERHCVARDGASCRSRGGEAHRKTRRGNGRNRERRSDHRLIRQRAERDGLRRRAGCDVEAPGHWCGGSIVLIAALTGRYGALARFDQGDYVVGNRTNRQRGGGKAHAEPRRDRGRDGEWRNADRMIRISENVMVCGYLIAKPLTTPTPVHKS